MSMPRIASACCSASSRVLGELDAARLAAAADLDLGLDHDRVAELLGGLDGLLHGGRVAPVRHGHAVLGEELLALVFEKVHVERRYGSARARWRGRARHPIETTDMALPKDVKFVTFDCYGTLIDWETGVYDAFQKEADRDGFTIDRDQLIPRFIEIQREIQRGSYELYAEVLRRTAVRVRRRSWAGSSSPSRSSFLPNSVPAWPPFRETNAQLERFAKKYETGHPLEHRRQAARRHAAPLPRRLRPGRDRAAGALLQAGPGALQGVRAPDRRQEGLGPHRLRLPDRRRALHQAEDPGDLGQPPRGGARGRPEEADRRGQDLPRRGASCSRPPRPRCAPSRVSTGRARGDERLLADQRGRAARRATRRC